MCLVKGFQMFLHLHLHAGDPLQEALKCLHVTSTMSSRALEDILELIY